jgi:hypothetical protein
MLKYGVGLLHDGGGALAGNSARGAGLPWSLDLFSGLGPKGRNNLAQGNALS